MSDAIRTTASQRYRQPVERVFAAWTTPELLERWYAPVPGWIATAATVDPRLGGGYSISFGPPPDGDRWVETGEYTAFAPGARLDMAIEVRSSDSVMTSRAEVRFHQNGEWTEVMVTETDYSDASDAASHAVGWQQTLDNLLRVISA